jgi:hypothetical protein
LATDRSTVALETRSHQTDALGNGAFVDHAADPTSALLHFAFRTARPEAVEDRPGLRNGRKIVARCSSEAGRSVQRVPEFQMTPPAGAHPRREVDKDDAARFGQRSLEEFNRDARSI